MQNPMIQNLVQFTHLEKTYAYLPGLSEATVTALFGLDEVTYREIKDCFDENAREAAQELLKNPSLVERVDRLTFPSGDTVMGIGDSFTDDLQSWPEIVRCLLGSRRPHDEIRVVNAGVSAQTTAMVLRRVVSLIAQEPDWIVCFLGGNDVTRIGPEPNKPQVSPEETAKNLEAMRRMAARLADARWVWITPPTFDEERAAAYPPFRRGRSHWHNEDVLAIANFVCEQEEPIVDLQAPFGLPVDPELQGPDGVHPSLASQKAKARAFVECLTP